MSSSLQNKASVYGMVPQIVSGKEEIEGPSVCCKGHVFCVLG